MKAPRANRAAERAFASGLVFCTGDSVLGPDPARLVLSWRSLRLERAQAGPSLV